MDRIRSYFEQLAGMDPGTPGAWYQLGIGITVAPRFQCRGYATEALRAIVGYLFGKLRKDRISASIDPRNIDSLDPTYAKAGLPPASSHDREPLV